MQHEKLVEASSPVLRQKAAAVAENSEWVEVVAAMREVLNSTPTGVGLAAPQIGKSLRIFITRFMGDEKVFINPKIVNKLGNRKLDAEGCLSLPGITQSVLRHEMVLIEYFDEKWIRHKEVFTGFLARIIQHEQDHLNGKLIIDYV